jgi:hypothetical protein
MKWIGEIQKDVNNFEAMNRNRMKLSESFLNESVKNSNTLLD